MSDFERWIHDVRSPFATLVVELENLRAAERTLRSGDTEDAAARMAASLDNLERLVAQGRRSIDALVAGLGAGALTAPPSDGGPEATKGRLTVLIVEDEAALLRAVTRRLSDHDVLGAATVGEARAVLALRPVDVVVCDAHLPDGDIRILLTWLAAARPDLLPRVVGMTGGAIDPYVARTWPTLPWARKPDDMSRIGWFVARAATAG